MIFLGKLGFFPGPKIDSIEKIFYWTRRRNKRSNIRLRLLVPYSPIILRNAISHFLHFPPLKIIKYGKKTVDWLNRKVLFDESCLDDCHQSSERGTAPVTSSSQILYATDSSTRARNNLVRLEISYAP